MSQFMDYQHQQDKHPSGQLNKINLIQNQQIRLKMPYQIQKLSLLAKKLTVQPMNQVFKLSNKSS